MAHISAFGVKEAASHDVHLISMRTDMFPLSCSGYGEDDRCREDTGRTSPPLQPIKSRTEISYLEELYFYRDGSVGVF